MVVWLGGVAALLVLGLALVGACFSRLSFAWYPDLVEFTGSTRLFRTSYSVVKWVRDPAAPGPCPLVVHLPTGDVGESQFTETGRLLQQGWVEVPYPPVPAEARLGSDTGVGLPRVVKFGHGDLRVATTHSDGVLTSVSVWVVKAGHETVAWDGVATRYSLSISGKRITLPLSEAEMVRALSAPAGRRKDY